LIPDNDAVLEKAMVINIEPPYSELGFAGLQVEDTLLITENGNEVLTTIDETLKV
jgi:Xaa-Pro aminopeptidase